MSKTNYDVELSISYSNAYRHYIPTYKVAVPYYKYRDAGDRCWAEYESYVSFDDGQESDIKALWLKLEPHVYPPTFFYNTESRDIYNRFNGTLIPDSGVFTKAYIRNPNRNFVTFTASNCSIVPEYTAKAAFEVQFNSAGFAANTNPTFKCSTIQKNTPAQYTWRSATVYYKKSTESSYSSAAGTVSGTWSDVTVSTNISLEDGYTYNIYIRAVGDDNSVANTPVGSFTTTDAVAVAKCLSPSGAFTSGDVTFVWSHATEYGTPQYAYDLQYSDDNGGSWTTVKSHEVTSNNSTSITLNNAGVYTWRVRTYNSNDVVGEWALATFVNNMPANPPTNVSVNTKGRPTVQWASTSQSAYQVQFLLGDSVAYDSGAVYTSETSHFVNQYFDDTRAYTVRVRTYNALGEVSDWTETGYQQPAVTDVHFVIEDVESGGCKIIVEPNVIFTKYYLLRNDKLVTEITNNEYIDKFAVGITSYSIVAVTSEDQADIQSLGYRVFYPHATIVAKNNQSFVVNKRVDTSFEIQTNNEADVNKANFIGDSLPTHYPGQMRLKMFTISCFDEQGVAEGLLGQMVFYADNFGNGGWCMVKSYDKTDNFIKNGQGIYANEVSLALEVTNYDDSIEYPV